MKTLLVIVTMSFLAGCSGMGSLDRSNAPGTAQDDIYRGGA